MPYGAKGMHYALVGDRKEKSKTFPVHYLQGANKITGFHAFLLIPSFQPSVSHESLLISHFNLLDFSRGLKSIEAGVGFFCKGPEYFGLCGL